MKTKKKKCRRSLREGGEERRDGERKAGKKEGISVREERPYLQKYVRDEKKDREESRWRSQWEGEERVKETEKD